MRALCKRKQRHDAYECGVCWHGSYEKGQIRKFLGILIFGDLQTKHYFFMKWLLVYTVWTTLTEVLCCTN